MPLSTSTHFVLPSLSLEHGKSSFLSSCSFNFPTEDTNCDDSQRECIKLLPGVKNEDDMTALKTNMREEENVEEA